MNAGSTTNGARACQQGYTLVELLVSSMLIVVCVGGVVTMTRKSRELDLSYRHRMRARMVIDSCFESLPYHYSNYANLADVSRSVVIDGRDPGDTEDDLSGTLAITVSAGQASADGGLSTIDYKSVQIAVSWDEPEGPEQITLTKYLAQL